MGFVLTRPVAQGGGSASTIQGMAITNINGQEVLTLVDITRSNKILSVAEHPVVFAENLLQHNDWIRIGTTNDAQSAYVADLNATIVMAIGQCENPQNNDKNINLYINNTDLGPIGSFVGNTMDTFINTTLDIDINQGDTIRLRAKDGISGRIRDSVIKLTFKWRG